MQFKLTAKFLLPKGLEFLSWRQSIIAHSHRTNLWKWGRAHRLLHTLVILKDNISQGRSQSPLEQKHNRVMLDGTCCFPLWPALIPQELHVHNFWGRARGSRRGDGGCLWRDLGKLDKKNKLSPSNNHDSSFKPQDLRRIVPWIKKKDQSSE